MCTFRFSRIIDGCSVVFLVTLEISFTTHCTGNASMIQDKIIAAGKQTRDLIHTVPSQIEIKKVI